MIVTSQRKLKKRAEARGMTGPEYQLVEMLEEVLTDLRWMQILAYTNQYLLNQKLSVSEEERDQILEAATRAVDKDSKVHQWRDRLGRLKAEIAKIHRQVGAESESLEGGLDGGPDGGRVQSEGEEQAADA